MNPAGFSFLVLSNQCLPIPPFFADSPTQWIKNLLRGLKGIDIDPYAYSECVLKRVND